MSAPTQLKIAAARGIVRNLYALSRFVRLFGIGHSRSIARLDDALVQLRALAPAEGIGVHLLGDRLAVEAIPLENGPAEQSFVRFLREAQRNAIPFDPKLTRETLEGIVSALAFERPAPAPVAAPPAADDPRDNWLSSASRLLYFVNVATEHAGTESTQQTIAHVSVRDLPPLLRVIARLGSSTTEGAALGVARELRSMQPALVVLLREVLASLVDQKVSLSHDALLLRVGDQVIIRFLLGKLEAGDITTTDVPAMLEQLNEPLNEISARAAMAGSSHLEALEQELWNTAPDAKKQMVLLFETPFYLPPASIARYIEILIGQGEEDLAAAILKNYGSAVDGRDAEGRLRSAKGVGEMAELFELVVPEYVPKLIHSISRQLMREPDSRMQALLSSALIRLSSIVQQQRDFTATAAAADALDEILHRRPMLGTELRPRIAVENRLPEFIDEALAGNLISDELVLLLQRHVAPVSQQLSSRFLNCTLRDETTRLTELASRMGEELRHELTDRLQRGTSEDALSTVGLLSSLAPEEVLSLLPRRTREWTRSQQDTLLRQLSVAASPERGSIVVKVLPDLDPLIVPSALDEIGMSGDVDAASTLVDIAMSEGGKRFSEYARVKAIEALGRLHATKAVDPLRHLVSERRMLYWAQPHELRISAFQALHMMDPELAAHLLPQSGLSERELSIGPLAIDPENPWTRQRRYQRIFPLKPMTALATSQTGRADLDIVAISLGGGRAHRQGKLQTGGNVTLQLELALRRLKSQVLVRDVGGDDITFEIADIRLSDRSRLRKLLLAQTAAPPPQPGAAA